MSSSEQENCKARRRKMQSTREYAIKYDFMCCFFFNLKLQSVIFHRDFINLQRCILINLDDLFMKYMNVPSFFLFFLLSTFVSTNVSTRENIETTLITRKASIQNSNLLEKKRKNEFFTEIKCLGKVRKTYL